MSFYGVLRAGVVAAAVAMSVALTGCGSSDTAAKETPATAAVTATTAPTQDCPPITGKMTDRSGNGLHNLEKGVTLGVTLNITCPNPDGRLWIIYQYPSHGGSTVWERYAVATLEWVQQQEFATGSIPDRSNSGMVMVELTWVNEADSMAIAKTTPDQAITLPPSAMMVDFAIIRGPVPR